MGLLVFREVVLAARRGVRVRPLADYTLSNEDPSVLAAAAASHRNVTIRICNPTRSTTDRLWLVAIWEYVFGLFEVNQRMHNNVMIVDGAVGLTGGRNETRREARRGQPGKEEPEPGLRPDKRSLPVQLQR